MKRLAAALVAATLFAGTLAAQMAQNPSPMVETTRAHPRLKEEQPPGRRVPLEVGTLFIPKKLAKAKRMPLFLHFHGGPWIPEVAAARSGRAATIAIQLGSGSSVYAKPFAGGKLFSALIEEAEAKAKLRFGPIWLTSWSAGYGAVREILKQEKDYRRVQGILLIDGLHTDYTANRQVAGESMEGFVRFARDAAAGRKKMVVTHSEIYPGTFSSTTETADYLLEQLRLRRKAVLKWGPMGTQQLSEVRKGGFTLLGFAGNAAPDHIDELHALPALLGRLR
jgi:hypothetical protein